MKHKDSLTTCERCGGDACYTSTTKGKVQLFLCYGCGFFTNSKATPDSEFVANQMEVLPEIYKDLAFTDPQNRVWFPTTTQTDTGIVFVNGTSTDNWKWAACLTTEGKMDMKTLKIFDQQGYMDAIEYIGAFT